METLIIPKDIVYPVSLKDTEIKDTPIPELVRIELNPAQAYYLETGAWKPDPSAFTHRRQGKTFIVTLAAVLEAKDHSTKYYAVCVTHGNISERILQTRVHLDKLGCKHDFIPQRNQIRLRNGSNILFGYPPDFRERLLGFEFEKIFED